MDAKPLSVGKILSERQRFVVPIYQRTYSWTTDEQLEPLFDQAEAKANERLATGSVAFSHYMGALLLIPDGEPVFGRIQTFNVVDGQQRLTTFHLLFAALRDVARFYEMTDIERQLADLVLHGDNVPMQAPSIERYKLQPTAYDRQLFKDLIDLGWEDIQKKYQAEFFKNGNIRGSAPLPLAAYWYFWERIEEFITETQESDDDDEQDYVEIQRRLVALSTVLFEDFRLIVITLSKDDDAQVIFETLNSGGKPLAAMDLVRNDVFLRASRRKEDEAELMDQHWSIFEQPFWKQEQTQGRIKKPRIDFFLGHVLAAERGEVVALTELYAEYKAFVSDRKFTDASAELSTLTQYVPTYRALVEPPTTGPLARLSRRLNTFDVSTAYPLVFVISVSDADVTTKERLFDFVASYVIRRALCGLTAKNYNKVFVEIASHLRTHGVTLENFAEAFSNKSTSDAARFPTDRDLKQAIQSRPQYGEIPQNRLRLLLEELEFASRDKYNVNGALQDGLSIEHVMPQSWAPEWHLPSGRAAPADLTSGVDESLREEINVRQSLLHTLGNLTLLTPPANSSIGKNAFEEKKVRLKDSLLKINTAIISEANWNEDAIKRRAATLADMAIKLWPAPDLRAAATSSITSSKPHPAVTFSNSEVQPQGEVAAFEKAMRNIYDTAAKECGYRPTYFLQMLNERGGIGAARGLLAGKISEGFAKLWELGRLDLTVEALVAAPQWKSLFTEAEIGIAMRRLLEAGYTPHADNMR